MANRSRRIRRRPVATVTQDSRFLNLPPELRNLVYEYVAQTTRIVSIRENQILYCPSMSLVCHQIRNEYAQNYQDEAPKYAAGIHVNITNFITRIKNGGAVSNLQQGLPDPAPGIERNWTVRVHLTNTWDFYRTALRNFIVQGDDLIEPDYDLEVVWDPKTFDVEFLRQNLQKLRFCHGRPDPVHATIWPKVEKALEEAFEKCSPTRPRGKQRKRKRTKQKIHQVVAKKPRTR